MTHELRPARRRSREYAMCFLVRIVVDPGDRRIRAGSRPNQIDIGR
jgi:hypothetical protein